MILKLIASASFIAAGTLYGSLRAERLSRELELSRAIGIALRRVAAMMRGEGADVYRLVSRLKLDADLSALGFLQKLPESFDPEVNFRETWRDSVLEEKYPEEETRILSTLGNEIGSSDIFSQLSTLEALEEDIARIENERRGELLKKGRLYRSVGALFGVMAGILAI